VQEEETEMEHVREIDGLAEADGRRLLATAFETAPVGEGLAGDGLAGAELLRRVRRRSTARRARTRALVPAGAVAALGGAAALGVTLTVASAPSAFAAVTAAAAKTSAESFKVTVHDTAGSQHIQVTGEFDPALGIGEETGPGGRQIVYTGQYIYMNLENKTAPGAAGKTWLKVPEHTGTPANPANLVKLLTAGLLRTAQANPQNLLAMLESAGTVREERPASGPGWTGTEYSFTTTAWPGPGPGPVTGTVDVDKQGRVRHLAATVANQQPDTGITVDVTFSDFGVPVSVTPPPASQVYSLPAGQAGGPKGGPAGGPKGGTAGGTAGGPKGGTAGGPKGGTAGGTAGGPKGGTGN
jgi:hypothetical protein